MFVKLNRDQN